VPAVLGAITSDATLAVERVTSAAKVVLVSGASTSPELSAISPFFFRTCPSDALQGRLLAKRAWAKGFRTVAITWTPGAYGMGLTSEFAQSFTALGGTISYNQMFTPGQSSYMDVLQAIYVNTPDAILLVAYAGDGAQIIHDYNTAYPFMQTFWFFTDSTQDSSFVAAVGASNFTFAHEGTGAAMPSGPAYATFLNAFMRNFGKQPEGYSPDFYDATYLVALALASAGESSGPTVQAKMRGVADPPGMNVGPGEWAMASAALQAGAKVNYQGASGPVDLDSSGDVVAPYSIWQVVGGTIMSIDPSVLP
jgi:branched-chain amino acid transport system substrate-binding protein